ncbi:MAG: Photosystem I assembly protein Ycf3 [Candidatus Heimdallarchaeota archaeon LC_2]|nr:MAG: Photosystem I assembly protein Ycf3 [Candidatus Heimdallarchaeota archaeon LC_2]
MESFSEIRDLIYKGKYDDAIMSTSLKIASFNFSPTEIIKLSLFKCIAELRSGNFEDALKISDQSFRIATQAHNSLLKIKSLKLKIEVLLKMHELDHADDILRNLFTIIEASVQGVNNNINYKNAIFYHSKGAIERYKGNFKPAVENYKKSLELNSEFVDEELRALTLNHLGITFDYLGNYEGSLSHYYDSLDIYEKLGYISYITGVSMNLGLLLNQKGKNKEALFQYNKALKIAKEIQDEYLYNMILVNTGLLNIDLGNLKSALDQFSESSDYFIKINNENGLIISYMNTGIVYDLYWEFEKALDYYNKAVLLANTIDEEIHLPKIIYNMGLTYRNTGNLEQAMVNFKKVLEISKQLDNRYFRAQILYQLIVTSVMANNNTEAEFYFELFEDIKDNEENIRIGFLYTLSKSIYLNSSDRIIHKAESQKLLQQIINADNVEYEILLEAILILSEILVKEYEWTHSEAAFNEINNLMSRLTTLSTEIPSQRVRIELLILESKTAFILRDINTAIVLLNKAEAIAEKEDLGYLRDRVSQEINLVEENIVLMRDISDQASLMLDLDKKLTSDYLDYVKLRFKPISSNV